MEDFLQREKKRLVSSNETVTVVLGNESCDLDSAISALIFSYFVYKANIYSGITLPVLNVDREDFSLRTEVVYLLQKVGFPIEELICKDEINLKELKDESRLRLVLVDHNCLSDEQSSLEANIVQIIDHHKVYNPDKISRYITKIESVGSCCSLVAEEILKYPNLVTPQIALLLFGTIIVDTVCLQESAKRVTQKDRDVVSQLESFLDGVGKEEIFQELQDAKFDISSLTPEQLLRKDTKYVCRQSTTVAIASMPILLEDVVNTEEFLSSLEKMILKKRLSFIVLMGTKMIDNGFSIRRQLAIFDESQIYLKKVSDYLQTLKDPSLELISLPTNYSSILLFNQQNSALSRKFVLPAIQDFLESRSIKDEL